MRGKVCDPACTLEGSSGAPRAEGRKQERLAPAHEAQQEASPKLRSPLGPIVLTTTPIAQALGGPGCARRRESKAHQPSCLLLFLPALPSSLRPGSKESRAPWASRAWPRALECRELTKGTSRLRMSAQWRGGAVYICLAVV